MVNGHRLAVKLGPYSWVALSVVFSVYVVLMAVLMALCGFKQSGYFDFCCLQWLPFVCIVTTLCLSCRCQLSTTHTHTQLVWL